jgi:hypothetical protein
MSAHGKKAAARTEASESTIYLDRDVAGTVVLERKGRVVALDAAGKRIGIFESARAAMAAILERARAVRDAKQ